MKILSKLLLFLTFLVLPFFVSAQMMGPKGLEGSWQGLVSGNECILEGAKCAPSHVKAEIPGLIPETKAKLDFHHFYYFAGLPLNVQRQVFLKDVKVTGTLYTEISTVDVRTIAVKQGNQWKTVWTMSKANKGM